MHIIFSFVWPSSGPWTCGWGPPISGFLPNINYDSFSKIVYTFVTFTLGISKVPLKFREIFVSL